MKASRSCDPSDFRGEALDVVLLALEHALGHEHREVRVLDAKLLDLVVKPAWTGIRARLFCDACGYVRWIDSQMLYDHGLRM
jgi:hypothetical protein